MSVHTSHSSSAEQKETATTPLLDEVKTREGRCNVDAGSDHGDDEGVLDARVQEERCTVVDWPMSDGICGGRRRQTYR